MYLMLHKSFSSHLATRKNAHDYKQCIFSSLFALKSIKNYINFYSVFDIKINEKLNFLFHFRKYRVNILQINMLQRLNTIILHGFTDGVTLSNLLTCKILSLYFEKTNKKVIKMMQIFTRF